MTASQIARLHTDQRSQLAPNPARSRPHKRFLIVAACQDQVGTSGREAHLDRRAALGWAAAALTAAAPRPAWARGMDSYIKKKTLDPLETYVPLVLEARSQLELVQQFMDEDPENARGLMRAGAFNGLRDNIKAVGEYAVGAGAADGASLAPGFFKALEGLDLMLFNAVREAKDAAKKSGDLEPDRPLQAIAVKLPEDRRQEAAERMTATLAALDALLATVPPEARAKAEAVVARVNARPGAGAPAGPGGAATPSEQELQELLMATP